MNNDFHQFLDIINRSSMEKLTHSEYATLRTLADMHLTYQTLFQLLSAKLPCKPGVKEAWETLGDRIMGNEEEVEKRRKLQKVVDELQQSMSIFQDQLRSF